MITTNTNGNPISQGFINAIRSDSPSSMGRLWFNDAELPCDIVSVTVEKGSCGSNPFMIGEVVGDYLYAAVKNLDTEIKGKDIEFHVGFLVGSSYEYVSLGKFKVSDVWKTRYQSVIVAYSHIVSDSGNDFNANDLTNPTIANVAIRLQSDLGCTISFDNGIDTTLSVTEQLSGLTDYQVLQVLAICCGGYIINTPDGNIRVKRYNATPTLSVDTGMMVHLPEIAEMPYKVRQIGVMVSESTTDNEGEEVEEIYYTLNAQEYIKVIKQGAEYYLEDENGNRIIANARPEIADIYFECRYMTQEIFETNIRSIIGYEYYPADIRLTLGDPRLEGSDVLSVEEIDGNLYAVPCHKVVHTYKGGFTTEVRSAEASDGDNSIGTEFPITQRLQTLDKKTGTAQATADNAFRIADNTNQYFWFKGEDPDETGAHITEVPQEQWEDPTSQFYHSGGNLLARSNGIAVRDGLDDLATFGANGSQVGQTEDMHFVILPSALKAEIGDVPILQIVPYGSLADGNSVHIKSDTAKSETGLYYNNAASSVDCTIGLDAIDKVASNRMAFLTLDLSTGNTVQTILAAQQSSSSGAFIQLIADSGASSSRAVVASAGDIVLDADTIINGTLTVQRHSSPIGTVKYATPPSDVTVQDNTDTEICHISLEAGVWMLIGSVRWESNTVGYRKINIYTTSGASDVHMTQAPVNGAVTQMVLPRIYEVSSTTTYYLNGLQNSGRPLKAVAGGQNWGSYLTAVRIA